MATILQSTLLNLLTPVIIFLFIFVNMYAVLLKTKIFGDNKNFNAIIAFAASLLFVITPEMRGVITMFIPWTVLLAGLVLFIFLFFMFLGVKEESMMEVAKSGPFATFAVIFIIILFLIAMTNVYGPFLMTNQNPGFWNAFKRAIFHPKTLGVLFILVVSAYAVKFLSQKD